MKKYALFFLLALAGCNTNTPSVQPQPVDPSVTDSMPLPLSRTGHLKSLSKRYGRKYWRPAHMYEAIRAGLPDTWDWRAKGFKVRIHDQGGCGSCYGDASVTCAMGTMMIFETPGQPVPELSLQEIVSCDRNNSGCGGGNFVGAFVKKYGLVSEAEFPYTASDKRCPSGLLQKKPTFAPHDYVYIGAPDRSPTEDEVDAAIYQFGYVGISYGADNAIGNYHGEGVFTNCHGTPTNHENAAFAYDRTQHALGLQNSWGKSFGRKSDPGTFFMKWGCNNLAEDAGYYVPAAAPCQPPKAHLPAEVILNQGDDLTLAVKAEDGVNYEWFNGTTSLGKGAVVTVDPPKVSMEVRLVASNRCGEAEIKMLVTVKQEL
jgi:hypothetical protein